jgi:hypothetical protein
MTTRNQIENLFDAFFEFPTEDKSHVTSTSCKLFAEHCVEKLGQTVEQEPVGEIYEQQHDGSYRAEMVVDLPIGTKLYTNPQPEQTALINELTDELNKTEAERVRWMTMALTSQPRQPELERAPLACECIESLFNESSCDISLGYFEEIVRMVEQEHGIGVDE